MLTQSVCCSLLISLFLSLPLCLSVCLSLSLSLSLFELSITNIENMMVAYTLLHEVPKTPTAVKKVRARKTTSDEQLATMLLQVPLPLKPVLEIKPVSRLSGDHPSHFAVATQAMWKGVGNSKRVEKVKKPHVHRQLWQDLNGVNPP